MTTLEAWETERERKVHGVEDTADLIVRLNAKAIVEAYRAGKEAGDAERDRLREAIKTHRHNVWGEGPVEHDEDRELYAVLAEGGQNAVQSGHHFE